MFLPNPLLSKNKNLARASNPILYPEYLYLSKSVLFLVSLRAQAANNFLTQNQHPVCMTKNFAHRQHKYSLHFFIIKCDFTSL